MFGGIASIKNPMTKPRTVEDWIEKWRDHFRNDYNKAAIEGISVGWESHEKFLRQALTDIATSAREEGKKEGWKQLAKINNLPLSATKYEEDYSHSHCFESEEPRPCGLRGVHRCCICTKEPEGN